MKAKTKILFDRMAGSIFLLILKTIYYPLRLVYKRDRRIADVNEILLVKLLGAGSLVIALPEIISLISTGKSVSLLTTRAVSIHFNHLGLFKNIYVLDDSSFIKLGSSLVNAFPKIFNKYDCILDLEVHSRFVSAIVGLTFSRVRIGFCVETFFWKYGIYTHLLYFNNNAPIYIHYSQMFSIINERKMTLESARNQLFNNPVDSDRSENYVIIGSSCSQINKERELSSDEWLTVFGTYLDSYNGRVYFLGAPTDFDSTENLISVILSKHKGLYITNACGLVSTEKLYHFISNAELFIGIDSLLLHIARFMGVPTISYWGPSDPKSRLRELDNGKDRIHYEQTLCSPCVHLWLEPPCHGNNMCIKNIFSKTQSDQIFWINHR